MSATPSGGTLTTVVDVETIIAPGGSYLTSCPATYSLHASPGGGAVAGGFLTWTDPLIKVDEDVLGTRTLFVRASYFDANGISATTDSAPFTIIVQCATLTTTAVPGPFNYNVPAVATGGTLT